MTFEQQRLNELISAIAPVVSIGIGIVGDSSSVAIAWQNPPTPSQLAQAQAALNSFDWSEAAEQAWLNLKARTIATGLMTDPKAEMKTLRALLLQALDDRNAIAAQHNALLAWLGTQVGLTNKAALNGFAIAAVTAAQAKTAIEAKISGGTADT